MCWNLTIREVRQIKKGVYIPIGVYLLTALLIFISCAFLYRNRITSTVPDDTGIQLAMEYGEVTELDGVKTYDYSTADERYIITANEQGETSLFYTDHRTDIGVLMVNGEVVERVDLRAMRTGTQYTHLSDTAILLILSIIVFGEVFVLFAYVRRLRA